MSSSTAGSRGGPIRGREELDALDFTEDPNQTDADLDDEKVRLHSGIDVSQLINQQSGVIFEPEIDESLLHPRAEDRNYFFNDEDEYDRAMAQMGLQRGADDDDENDGYDGTFENLASKMTDLVPGGGVKKLILVKGLEGDGKPTDHGTVTIHYSLYLEGQDESYDSTVLRGRAERYRLDDGRLIMGLEIAVKSMMKKEKSRFLINPEYAFGMMGCPPRVPPDAQIMATIEMLNFVQEAATDALLALAPEERMKKKSFEEIVKLARVENKEGNDYVKDREWKMAARRYGNGIRLLEDVEMKDDEEEKTQRHQLLKFYLNRSHCFNKVMWPKKACIDLQKALNLEPRNAKALYRMGKAKRMLGNIADARHYLLRAQRIAPEDTDIGQELASLDRQIDKDAKDRRALCQRMFPGAQVPPPSSSGYSTHSGNSVDDEVNEELYRQIEEFTKNEEASMPLPESFVEAEIACAKRIADIFELTMTTTNSGGRVKYFIVKKV